MRFVVVVGGGVDAAGKSTPQPASGNFVYILDASTGAVIYKREVEGCVPAVAVLDEDGDRIADAIYAGTTAGRVYRIDLRAPAPLVRVTVRDRRGAPAAADRVAPGAWEPLLPFRTGDDPPIYEQLQILLKDDPDNPTFLNDLGFIWADHDMNIEESEKLIRKAIDKDREQRKKIEGLPKSEDVDNAAYMDSLGWVLFKKKDYKEAKKYLLESTKLEGGKHIEIYDHLADVHLALGEKADAVKVWKESLTFENLSKREKERRKVIEKKLAEAEKK